MDRSPQYVQGYRAGVKWAITWLHERAKEMGDRYARTILDTRAFEMGVEAKQKLERDNLSR